LSRARDQLVVCGDTDFMRAFGGADLARRLNLETVCGGMSLERSLSLQSETNF